MSDLIDRQAAIDALKNDMASLDHIIKGMSAYDVRLDAYVSQRNQVSCDIDTINNLLPEQPEPCEDDPRADVYYLAEKIGIHQLYALVVQLRGEPEPCEDAVSREKINKFCHEVIKRDPDGDNDIVKAFEAFRAYVNSLPPVTPKQRTGYWYPVGIAEVVGGESAQWGSAIAYHRCSECDEQALKDDFEQEVLSDFCPHCGVKMEGVSE